MEEKRKACGVLEQKLPDRDHLEDMRRWGNSIMCLKEKACKRRGLD
jgi:hypothetical protein